MIFANWNKNAEGLLVAIWNNPAKVEQRSEITSGELSAESLIVEGDDQPGASLALVWSNPRHVADVAPALFYICRTNEIALTVSYGQKYIRVVRLRHGPLRSETIPRPAFEADWQVSFLPVSVAIRRFVDHVAEQGAYDEALKAVSTTKANLAQTVVARLA